MYLCIFASWIDIFFWFESGTMTTAARPTWDTAKGGRGKGEGDLSALSKQYSSRDLPSHTKLKHRYELTVNVTLTFWPVDVNFSLTFFWLYYPGGREAGFWNLFLSSQSGFSQNNETQEVTVMKFFRCVRMKLLKSICIHMAVSFLFLLPKKWKLSKNPLYQEKDVGWWLK